MHAGCRYFPADAIIGFCLEISPKSKVVPWTREVCRSALRRPPCVRPGSGLPRDLPEHANAYWMVGAHTPLSSSPFLLFSSVRVSALECASACRISHIMSIVVTHGTFGGLPGRNTREIEPVRL